MLSPAALFQFGSGLATSLTSGQGTQKPNLLPNPYVANQAMQAPLLQLQQQNLQTNLAESQQQAALDLQSATVNANEMGREDQIFQGQQLNAYNNAGVLPGGTPLTVLEATRQVQQTQIDTMMQHQVALGMLATEQGQVNYNQGMAQVLGTQWNNASNAAQFGAQQALNQVNRPPNNVTGNVGQSLGKLFPGYVPPLAGGTGAPILPPTAPNVAPNSSNTMPPLAPDFTSNGGINPSGVMPPIAGDFMPPSGSYADADLDALLNGKF